MSTDVEAKIGKLRNSMLWQVSGRNDDRCSRSIFFFLIHFLLKSNRKSSVTLEYQTQLYKNIHEYELRFSI